MVMDVKFLRNLPVSNQELTKDDTLAIDQPDTTTPSGYRTVNTDLGLTTDAVINEITKDGIHSLIKVTPGDGLVGNGSTSSPIRIDATEINKTIVPSQMVNISQVGSLKDSDLPFAGSFYSVNTIDYRSVLLFDTSSDNVASAIYYAPVTNGSAIRYTYGTFGMNKRGTGYETKHTDKVYRPPMSATLKNMGYSWETHHIDVIFSKVGRYALVTIQNSEVATGQTPTRMLAIIDTKNDPVSSRHVIYPAPSLFNQIMSLYDKIPMVNESERVERVYTMLRYSGAFVTKVGTTFKLILAFLNTTSTAPSAALEPVGIKIMTLGIANDTTIVVESVENMLNWVTDIKGKTWSKNDITTDEFEYLPLLYRTTVDDKTTANNARIPYSASLIRNLTDGTLSLGIQSNAYGLLSGSRTLVPTFTCFIDNVGNVILRAFMRNWSVNTVTDPSTGQITLISTSASFCADFILDFNARTASMVDKGWLRSETEFSKMSASQPVQQGGPSPSPQIYAYDGRLRVTTTGDFIFRNVPYNTQIGGDNYTNNFSLLGNFSLYIRTSPTTVSRTDNLDNISETLRPNTTQRFMSNGGVEYSLVDVPSPPPDAVTLYGLNNREQLTAYPNSYPLSLDRSPSRLTKVQTPSGTFPIRHFFLNDGGVGNVRTRIGGAMGSAVRYQNLIGQETVEITSYILVDTGMVTEKVTLNYKTVTDFIVAKHPNHIDACMDVCVINDSMVLVGFLVNDGTTVYIYVTECTYSKVNGILKLNVLPDAAKMVKRTTNSTPAIVKDKLTNSFSYVTTIFEDTKRIYIINFYGNNPTYLRVSGALHSGYAENNDGLIEGNYLISDLAAKYVYTVRDGICAVNNAWGDTAKSLKKLIISNVANSKVIQLSLSSEEIIFLTPYTTDAFTVKITDPIPCYLGGRASHIPVQDINLKDFNTDPRNKVFYIYALLNGNAIDIECTTQVLAEATDFTLIAVVKTNDTRIIEITASPFIRLDKYRISENSRGASIPVSGGFPFDEEYTLWE